MNIQASENHVAIPPGTTIREQLLIRGLTQKEFANRMDLTEKHVSKLINGNVALTQQMALRLESVLGLPASFWNNLETTFREAEEKVKEENELVEEMEVDKLKINISDINKDSIIVCKFNRQKETIENVCEISNEIKTAFPDNKVIMMPDDITLCAMSKEDTLLMIRDILDYLKRGETDEKTEKDIY